MFKNKGDSNVVYKCTVRLLEDTDILECEFQLHHKGRFLLEHVCEQLGLAEKDYFGLRLLPTGRSALFLQLKRDLRHGRLYCSVPEAAALGALVVQDELGDYDPDLHMGDYVSHLKLSLRQTEALERRVAELHASRTPGQPAQAPRDEFLSLSSKLETYGVDPHPVKDHRGTQLYLGLNHSGISTFSSGRRAQHFRWPEVHKINYEGKMFIAHLTYTDKKHTVGFKCPTGSACRHVWRCAIEQMLFFTLPTSSDASVVSGGGFFSWGTKFRYSGRTEREILSDLLPHRQALGSPTKRKANSVPATPSSPQGDMAEIRYSSLPRSALSAPLTSSSMSEPINSAYCPESALPLLETVPEDAGARRMQGLENIDPYNDYYFRDSFDHSSSESQLTSLGGELSSRRAHKSEVLKRTEQHANNASAAHKKFSLLQAFIPSFIFVVIVLFIVAILVLETDSDYFASLKNWPEMVSLRYQYYQPMKEYITKLMTGLF